MLKKTLLLLFFIPTSALVVSILSSFTTPNQKEQVLRTIIIDAGHGIMANGGHNGAKGTYSYEDDICLAVSKKLVVQMKQEFPDVKIIETRPDKYIVDLHERADIANSNKGDLFISIHVNAMPEIQKKEFLGYKNEVYYTKKGKKKIKHTRKVAKYRYYSVPNTGERGTQTYIWGAHKGEAKEVAVRENAPMLAEDNYKEKYGEVDVNSPEFIALSLAKTLQFQRRSSTLANMVEEQFSKAGRVSGGPKQRQVGIWVLQATAMPSVLVETGFITNPQEEDYLNSAKGQDEIATCITDAVKEYKSWLEKKQLPSEKQTNSQPPVKMQANKNIYGFLEAVEQNEKRRAK
ncbi:MAG TPA: N-acetylmuramoyl-L-alanine amidase [Flavisolibacter sp.]|jgi:N-acetylmuramoyl-L-alanine amidase|nr:N-acetylmuramoyl-L-alanine amidase [Flavisolibacter sp.]